MLGEMLDARCKMKDARCKDGRSKSRMIESRSEKGPPDQARPKQAKGKRMGQKKRVYRAHAGLGKGAPTKVVEGVLWEALTGAFWGILGRAI